MADVSRLNKRVRELSAPSPFRSWLALASDWLGIAAIFAVVIGIHLFLNWPMALKIPLWFLAALLLARQQLALAILMHDGAHRRMFKSQTLNDWVCQFLCAGPLFFSMYSYQKLHLKHHRQPLAVDDPDLSLIGGYPISARSFARKILRDASGISYIKFIRYFIHLPRRKKSAPEKPQNGVGGDNQVEGERILSTITSQERGNPLGPVAIGMSILIFSAISLELLHLLDSAWLFLFFWFLPAVTLLQVLLRIRGIAEHSGYGPSQDQRLNARTVVNPLQTFFVAPHNVNYHIEHHVYPSVPYYNLPHLHKLMMAEDLIPKSNLYTGYRAVLADLIK